MECANVEVANAAAAEHARVFRYSVKDILADVGIWFVCIVLGNGLAQLLIPWPPPSIRWPLSAFALWVAIIASLVLALYWLLARPRVRMSQNEIVPPSGGRRMRWDAVCCVRVAESPRGETRKIELIPYQGSSASIDYCTAMSDIRKAIEERLDPSVPFCCRRERFDWGAPWLLPTAIAGSLAVFAASLIW